MGKSRKQRSNDPPDRPFDCLRAMHLRCVSLCRSRSYNDSGAPAVAHTLRNSNGIRQRSTDACSLRLAAEPRGELPPSPGKRVSVLAPAMINHLNRFTSSLELGLRVIASGAWAHAADVPCPASRPQPCLPRSIRSFRRPPSTVARRNSIHVCVGPAGIAARYVPPEAPRCPAVQVLRSVGEGLTDADD